MQLFTLLLSPSYIAKAAMSSIMVTFLLSSPPTLQEDNISDQISVVSSKDQSYDAFSSTYDRLNGGSVTSALGIDDMRRLANQYVSGDVLEVAVGTGLQSQYYSWPRLTSFVGIDVSEGMLVEARKRILTAQGSSSAIPIKLQQMDAKEMKFGDNQFDSVVDTFSLCVIDDPLQTLKEMRRVVKSNGNVILLENSVSLNPLLAKVQDLTEAVITPLSKGCRWNVNIPSLAKEAGLEYKEGKDIQLGTIMYGVYRKMGE